MVETNTKIFERALKLFCTLLLIGAMGTPFGGLPPMVHARDADSLVSLKATAEELVLDGIDLSSIATLSPPAQATYFLTNEQGYNVKILFNKPITEVETHKNKTIYKLANGRFVFRDNGQFSYHRDSKKKPIVFKLNPDAYFAANELREVLEQSPNTFFELHNDTLRINDLVLLQMFAELFISVKIGRDQKPIPVAQLEILANNKSKHEVSVDSDENVSIAVPNY